MVETVHPGLGVWLRAFNGANIMRFSVVWREQFNIGSSSLRRTHTIPSDDFHNVHLVSICDQLLPTARIEPIVRVIQEVFIVGIRAIVLIESQTGL
jgi:hypothetical protein